MKTIYVDFDGVLHQYVTPWTNAETISDPPVEGAIAWLRELLQHPDIEVAIYSSRNQQPGGSGAMALWLMDHGMLEGEVAQIAFPTAKGPAWVTIDDRGWQFNGPPFPTVDELLAFRPWNRRGEGGG